MLNEGILSNTDNARMLKGPRHADFADNCPNRVWKGFCVIRDSAEIELVIRECRENPAAIREFCIGCDAGFSLSVVRDS